MRRKERAISKRDDKCALKTSSRKKRKKSEKAFGARKNIVSRHYSRTKGQIQEGKLYKSGQQRRKKHRGESGRVSFATR